MLATTGKVKTMKSYAQEHELQRRRLWAEVWSSTASANDCKNPSTATVWADKALEAFDGRFSKMTDPLVEASNV